MSVVPDEVTALAYFWTVQRRDGAGFAATSHDQPVVHDDVAYAPETGLAPAAMTLTDTMIGSALDVEGVLESDWMTEPDLRAGRWDQADFALACGDWSSGEVPKVLCRGRMGAIVAAGTAIRATVEIVPEQLVQQHCPLTSPECRATLGDRHCGVSLRTRKARSQVSDILDDWVSIGLEDPARFEFGQLLWVSGANCGVRQSIMQAYPGKIRLREQPPLPVRVGDRLQLTEGCDGRLATCFERFDNVANFRGEPCIPGTDFLMRYPGA